MYSQPSTGELIGPLIGGIVLAFLAYGAFPLLYIFFSPKVTFKTYRRVCFAVNFLVFLAFCLLNGTYNAVPYVLWTFVVTAILKNFNDFISEEEKQAQQAEKQKSQPQPGLKATEPEAQIAKTPRPSFIWPVLTVALLLFSAGLSYWSYNEINALKLSAELQVAEAHGRGYAEGETQGYKAGYEEAYALAYDEGYTAGTNDTYDAAYQAGYDEGSAAGYKDGRDFGYNSGFSAGEIEGYKIGSGKEYKASDYYVAKAKYEEAKSASNTGDQPTTYETLKQMAEAATSGKEVQINTNFNYNEQKKAAYNEIMQAVDAATKGKQNSEFEDLMAAAQAANANPDSYHAKNSSTYEQYNQN